MLSIFIPAFYLLKGVSFYYLTNGHCNMVYIDSIKNVLEEINYKQDSGNEKNILS